MTGTVRELLTADTEPALTVGNSLAYLAGWADAVKHGSQTLGDAGREGRLALGTRGILARHILFIRMGFTARQQAIWARTAKGDHRKLTARSPTHVSTLLGYRGAYAQKSGPAGALPERGTGAPSLNRTQRRFRRGLQCRCSR